MIRAGDGLSTQLREGFARLESVDEHLRYPWSHPFVTKDPPRSGIHDPHQVEPPFLGLDVGQATDPKEHLKFVEL